MFFLIVRAGYEDPPMFGQLITVKQDWGISRLSKSHFKLLVRVEVCAVNAVDTDKWCRRWAVLEVGAANLPDFCNLYGAETHQGHASAHHCRARLVLAHWKMLQYLPAKTMLTSSEWKQSLLSGYLKNCFRDINWCFFLKKTSFYNICYFQSWTRWW